MIPGKLTGAMDAPIIHQYRDRLLKKKGSLLCKRAFDLIVSALMLICLSPLLLVLALPWGVAGVAIATVISQAISSVVMR